MTVGIGKEGETVSILRARIVTFLPSFLFLAAANSLLKREEMEGEAEKLKMKFIF